MACAGIIRWSFFFFFRVLVGCAQPKSVTIRNFPSVVHCNAFGTPAIFAHLPSPDALPSSLPLTAPPSPSPSAWLPDHQDRCPSPNPTLSLPLTRPGRATECPSPLISPFIVYQAHPLPRFNIYIYDYCNKRGFRKTARELLAEAEIPADSAPPINAKQGLLFESVPPTSLRWPIASHPSPSSQVVERILGALHSQKQWRRNRGCHDLHSGTCTLNSPSSSPRQHAPQRPSTKYNRLTTGRVRDLSATSSPRSIA